ncbi:MAG: RNA-binding protein [Pseudomonadota bacterium]|nr:MAG: RNA-binding protein [Pseudomonadota bacterium]
MTGKQKRLLRTMAHTLKPVVNLGKHGLSPETKSEIDTQLLEHELIKLKILDSCPISKKECADVLNKKTLTSSTNNWKNTYTYCPHPEEPKLNFPQHDLHALHVCKNVHELKVLQH